MRNRRPRPPPVQGGHTAGGKPSHLRAAEIDLQQQRARPPAPSQAQRSLEAQPHGARPTRGHCPSASGVHRQQPASGSHRLRQHGGRRGVGAGAVRAARRARWGRACGAGCGHHRRTTCPRVASSQPCCQVVAGQGDWDWLQRASANRGRGSISIGWLGWTGSNRPGGGCGGCGGAGNKSNSDQKRIQGELRQHSAEHKEQLSGRAPRWTPGGGGPAGGRGGAGGCTCRWPTGC